MYLATKCKWYRHVRAWANWCEEQGLTDGSPISDLPKPQKEGKEAAWIKPEDVDRLYIAIEHHMETTQDAVGRMRDLQWLRDMNIVTVGTGLRRGELIALRWAEVDLDDGSIRVRHRDDFSTKGNRECWIPVVGDTLNTLRRMDAEREGTLDGPVFTDRDGKPVKPDRATKRFKDMARLAGLDERVHFHSLRHTTGSWLAMKGVPMRVIQSILGHSSVNVTERYSRLAPETLTAAMEETFGQ